MSSLSRRDLLRKSSTGAATVTLIGTGILSPREARASGQPFQRLDPETAALIEAFGETLAPGAAEAGIAHFIDAQLAKEPADSLLMIRYLDIPPPHLPFYAGGMRALDITARQRHGKGYRELTDDQKTAFVREISAAPAEGWPGPPSNLVYFVLRADAVDVVYGTEEGFERLGIPYLPHIAPETKW
jgi:hypothetical protein